jgi:nicotinamide-nucleotide amidase
MTDPVATLAAQVGARLSARGERLALAESCTGGLVSKLVTDVAGCSAWFDRGLVTYSNQAKQALLQVPAAILERDGAVSGACVAAMCEGLLAQAPVDWAIAISGIAGPGGGSADKPVGTVWIAWQRRGAAPGAQRHQFDGDRDAIRIAAAETALRGLLERA